MKIWIEDMLHDFKEDVKKSWKSWTIWFAGIAELIVEYLPQITQAVTDSEQYMLPETYKRVMQGIIIVNVLLRFKTTKRLSDK